MRATPALASSALVLLLSGSMAVPRLAGSHPDGPVVAFGDSLTVGVGAAPGESYPALLAADLGIPVLNRGVSGQTAAEGLRRIGPDVVQTQPRLAIVLFGANEALHGQPLGDAVAGLDAILADLGAQGIPVLLLGIQYHGYGADFGAALRDLAARHGATLLPDVLAGILDDPALTADGGYHPDAAGYRVMESRILAAAQAMLAGGRA